MSCVNDTLRNALASVQIEGYEFTDEQIQFISDLVRRIDGGEISWDEAVQIVKERHNERNDTASN